MITTTNICIFGDSIAYGAWDDAGGWPDRLRAYLHGQTLRSHFQSYYFCYALGIPGDTTENLMRRFSAECAVREPQVIIFAVGINDSRWQEPGHTPRVKEDAFRKNVSALIAAARRLTPRIVFIGLTPVDENKTMPFEPDCAFENERIRYYNDTIRHITQKESVLFLDVATALSPATDLEDGLHPNRHGHEKLFALVRDFLTEHALI